MTHLVVLVSRLMTQIGLVTQILRVKSFLRMFKMFDLCLKKINFGLGDCKTILFNNINEGMQMFKMLFNGLRKN